MDKLTDKQKLMIDSIAAYQLLEFIAESEVAAKWAEEDTETLSRLFLAGCQAGCAASIAVLEAD